MGTTQRKSDWSLSGHPADAPEAVRARCPLPPARRGRGARRAPSAGTERSPLLRPAQPSPAPGLRLVGVSQRGAAAFETQPHISSSAYAGFLLSSPAVPSDRTGSEITTKHRPSWEVQCVGVEVQHFDGTAVPQSTS